MAVRTAIEIFEDQIGSLSRDIHLKAYKTLVQSYRMALTAVWDSTQLADITLILETVHDKEMSELAVMVQKLELPTPSIRVVKEKKRRPYFRNHNWTDDS